MRSSISFAFSLVVGCAAFEMVQLRCYAGEGNITSEVECGQEPVCCFRKEQESGTVWGCIKTTDIHCLERSLEPVEESGNMSCCHTDLCNGPSGEDSISGWIEEMENAERKIYESRKVAVLTVIVFIVVDAVLVLMCSLCSLKGVLYCRPPI
ncbi:hypothetical protein Tcan_10600 [Toxocara canis]|uniref:Uncharacterized protein n=1 Tax=Toxocara canis TaxID=6265 RepID=A0A0B2UV57_TOXCA|nr:hypothetical protein Tcan_10600 [Toxocara canis]